MADYYPLLSKAVAALPSSTPETRAAIYGRARKALMAQLRSPALAMSEADIEREAASLDAVVERIERELDGAVADPPPAPPKPVPSPVPLAPPKSNVSTRPVPGKSEKLDKAVARMRQQAEAGPAKKSAPPAKNSSARFWIVFATLVVIVVVIGATAYLLRDKPEDLARLKENAFVQKVDADNGKITGRADGPKGEPSNPVPTIKVAVIPIRPPDVAPPKVTTQPPPPVAPAAMAPKADPAPVLSTAAATIPVAYRSALLIQTTDDPQKIKTYIGSVTWKTETISGDPSQPLSMAVDASIDIPDAKLKATVTLKRNTDQAFSASHTIVLGFKLAPGSPVAKLKEIDVPALRNEDSPSGDSLTGVGVVPIMDDFFLVGLAPGEDNVTRNVDLIRSKGWFDIPIQLGDGKLAKLTFEKGVQGQQAINDALAAWH